MQKLSPDLLASLEKPADTEAEESDVQVIVALACPLDEKIEEELVALGLDINSRMDEMATGTIALTNLEQLAGHTAVVKIEGASAMYVEPSDLTE